MKLQNIVSKNVNYKLEQAVDKMSVLWTVTCFNLKMEMMKTMLQ